MLLQHSSASSCMRACMVTEKQSKYKRCLHSTPFVLNCPTQFIFSVSQYTSDTVVLAAWILPIALLSCPRKQLPSAYWQADNICLNFIGQSGEHVCIHCFECSFGFNIHKWNHVSSPVTHMMWLRNSSPYSWYHSKKSKPKSFSAFCVHTWEQNVKFLKILIEVLKLWSTHFLVKTSNKIIIHYKVDHSAFHHKHMLTHLWTFYTTVLISFTDYILVVNCCS
jgi:hypothetical protein